MRKSPSKSDDRKKSRRPTITGKAKAGTKLASNVDLFVFKINKEVNDNQIVKFMKDNSDLNVLDIELKSNPKAKTKSYRIQIRSSDTEDAMNAYTWHATVRVRPFCHQRYNRGGTGVTQFSKGSNSLEVTIALSEFHVSYISLKHYIHTSKQNILQFKGI